MRIGDIHIDTPVLLAPMAAVTDLPFRTVCEEQGVGLTITEFLSAHALSAGDPKAVDKMTPSLAGRRFGVQIFGREHEPMIAAANMAVAIGASVVDINMGCPAKRVVAGACGSALMKEPALAQELVKTVVAAVPAHVPVTVKHRAGWDDMHRNAAEFACAMVDAGARMITVHGRTRTQGFAGRADLAIIRQVRDSVPADVPVIGNGDVVDVEGFSRMRGETGCDAVMIGRGAMGNPWLFRSIRELAAGRPDPGRPDIEERLHVFRRHVALVIELRESRAEARRACGRTGPPADRRGAGGGAPNNGGKLIHEIRKASAWYAKGLYGANTLRQRIWNIPDWREVVRCVEEHFEGLAAFSAAA